MVVPRSEKREQVLKLIADKDALEVRIREHGRVLQAVRQYIKKYSNFSIQFLNLNCAQNRTMLACLRI